MENMSELDVLKQRATVMGIKYHPSIGVEALRIKVNNKINGIADTDTTPYVDPNVGMTPVTAFTETIEQRNARLRKEANKLVRVRLVCLNPDKRLWPGEIITVSNSVVGTLKKFIPFNADAGYHIPSMMLSFLKERQFQQFNRVKLPGGRVKIVTKLVKEFAIEILPPLTKDELTTLANQQALNHSID